MSVYQPLREQQYLGPYSDKRRYLVVDKIGCGSYGTVMSAKNKKGSLVAIKRLGPVNRMRPRGIFFRDIKLENIVMDEGNRLMLCDLGCSKCTRFDTVCNSLVGTPRYIAPELLQYCMFNPIGIMDVPKYDGKALDLYAAGVCLYVMIYGEYPERVVPGNYYSDFNSPGPSDPFQNLSKNFPLCSKRGPVSDDCCNLIAGLLHPDPKKRLTMEGILSHPWFMKNLPEGFHAFNKRVAKKNVERVLATRLANRPVEEELLLNSGDYRRNDGELRIENNERGGARKTSMVSLIRKPFEKVGLWIKNLLMCRAI
ncbi:hypothetical protein BSKO_05807 [Bryopsis sp. KO-2023]|nr:hypothetical protein BSKO_05807 [Bryopsis sp. KO-2023]